MPIQKNKKIFIYIFIFLLIGTFNNKNINEILGNIKLSLISVLLLESIYFYNFTTPEFNVNVCQLPFWSLVVFYSWKIYETKEIKFKDYSTILYVYKKLSKLNIPNNKFLI